MWGNQAGFLWGAMQPAASGPTGVGGHRRGRRSPLTQGLAHAEAHPLQDQQARLLSLEDQGREAQGPSATSNGEPPSEAAARGPAISPVQHCLARAAQACRQADWLCPSADPITPQGQLPLAPEKMGVFPTRHFTLLVNSFLRAPITKHNSPITPEAEGALSKGSSGSRACAWPGRASRGLQVSNISQEPGKDTQALGRQCSPVVLWRGRGLPVGEAEARGGEQHGRRAHLSFSFGVTWRKLRMLST